MSSLFGIGGGGNVGAAGGFYSYSIDQSLRFNDNDSAYLNRTFASAGNQQIWTWSGWVKRGNLASGSAGRNTFFSGSGTQIFGFMNPTTNATADNFGCYLTDSEDDRFMTNAVFRDTSAWYHFCLAFDSTAAVNDDRLRLWVNGVQETSWSRFDTITQNRTTGINAAAVHAIGVQANASSQFFDGYMAEVNFIDGTALDPTSFGETINGIWVPKQYSGSYGTNGFYLSFADSAAIGDDLSGNTNDFTATNLAASDVVSDSPTDNAVTWDYNNRKGVTLSEGNLYFNVGTSQGVCATMPTATTGKWYFEFKVNGAIGPYNPIVWGFSSQEKQTFANYTTNPRDVETSTLSAYTDSSTWQVQAKESGTLTTISPPTAQRPAQNSIIGIAYDADTGKAWMSVNNVWLDSSGGTTGDPSTGANPTHTFTSGIAIFPAAFDVGGIQPQGILQADDNVLTYTPPTDFLTIKSSNMPEPAIGPNSATTSDEHFNTVLWTGDGTTGRSITSVNFSPNFVWTKGRSGARQHLLFDTIRGNGAYLLSATTNAEATDTNTLTTFDSDGFTIGSNININTNTETYVGWNWKAGGTAVSNTDGSTTSNVSANTDAGFSIITWLANAATGTVGHGLSSAPELVIAKPRDDSGTNWYVMHTGALTASQVLNLDGTTGAFTPGVAHFNSTYPTSSVISYGGYLGNALTNNNKLAYCFHSVEGFSRVTSYVGNGSSDGTFCHLGHRPAWIMIKNASASSAWYIFDVARNTYNAMDNYLRPNLSNAEGNLDFCDFTSNGFKIRSSAAEWNGSGNTIIVLSFAEQPFKYSNAR